MTDSRYKWLTNLRWIAAAGIIIFTLISSSVFHVSLQEKQLFIIAALLLLSNFFYILLERKTSKDNKDHYYATPQGLVVSQIAGDLILLTFLLHFSGGVENPFIIYYVFHLMLASILLSRTLSYLIATFTMILVGLMAIGEFLGWFPHYSLTGFLTNGYYNNPNYLSGTGFVFVTTSYVVVYMTGTVSERLRKKEQACRQTNMELLDKDKIKNEYVLRITHDIKGHLAAIRSCLDASMMDLSSGQKKEFIDRAYDRTGKLLTFIQELLRITQLRLANDIMKESFSLKKEIEEQVINFNEDLRAKGLAIDLDLKTDTLSAGRSMVIVVPLFSLLSTLIFPL